MFGTDSCVVQHVFCFAGSSAVTAPRISSYSNIPFGNHFRRRVQVVQVDRDVCVAAVRRCISGRPANTSVSVLFRSESQRLKGVKGSGTSHATCGPEICHKRGGHSITGAGDFVVLCSHMLDVAGENVNERGWSGVRVA